MVGVDEGYVEHFRAAEAYKMLGRATPQADVWPVGYVGQCEHGTPVMRYAFDLDCYRAGDPLYLLLDDTQKRKRGKRMAAVSKIFLHAEKVYANGHTILGAALSYRHVIIPCAVRLWAAESCCDGKLEAAPGVPLKSRKLTHWAAHIVEAAQSRVAGKVIVLLNSYYLCPAVIRARKAAGYRYDGNRFDCPASCISNRPSAVGLADDPNPAVRASRHAVIDVGAGARADTLRVRKVAARGPLGSEDGRIEKLGTNHFKVTLGHAPSHPDWRNMPQFRTLRNAKGNRLRLDVRFPGGTR